MVHTLKSNYHKSFETEIVASTTQTQGNSPLTAHINEVGTVTNDSDVVTLPTTNEGLEIVIINNTLKNLQIFPASGNDLGNGLNLSTILEFNEEIKLFAISDTKWHIEDTTEIFHVEIHDEDNTDAYVISKVNENHCYHSSGIIVGDGIGWTYTSGGTVAISSIADGSGGEITVETSSVHGLAVGDIISQNDMTNSAYSKVFIVNTIVDTTHYKVTATFTATETGTMNKAATITCEPIAAGSYAVNYDVSAFGAVSAEVFKFFIYKNATKIAGSKRKKNFVVSGRLYDVSKGLIVHIDAGDKISMVLKNTTATGNITIEDQDIILIKL